MALWVPPWLMLPDGHLPRAGEGLVRQVGERYFHHRMLLVFHPSVFNFQNAHAHVQPPSCFHSVQYNVNQLLHKERRFQVSQKGSLFHSVWLTGFPSGFPGDSDGKASACSAGDLGLIPGLGRSPGGGHGNPLQYSCLENPMDRGAWQAASWLPPWGSQRVCYN